MLQVGAQAGTVIALSNLPLRRASALVQEIADIDLLVATLPRQLPDTAAVSPDTGTLVVSAELPFKRHTGRRVGRLQITVQPDGSLTGASWHTLAMDREIPHDPEMRALLKGFGE